MSPDVNQPSKTSDELETLVDDLAGIYHPENKQREYVKTSIQSLIESEIQQARMDEARLAESWFAREQQLSPQECARLRVRDLEAQLRVGDKHE